MKLEITQGKNFVKTKCCNANLRTKYCEGKKTLLGGNRYIQYLYCVECLTACDCNLNIIGSHNISLDKLIPN
jgi:hypothetical protein